MKERRWRRWGLILSALAGAAVLVIVVIALLARGSGAEDSARPTPPQSLPSGSTAPTSTANGNDIEVVDPGVVKRGWVPEPITEDADVYARAALKAAATFDTRRATRQEWLNWLGTWFTPSPLYDDPQDALDQMAGYKAELAQTVVLPQSQWDGLAHDDGHVSARVDGQVEYLDQPDATQKVRTATANIVMTYTQAGDGAGREASYDQTVRVSVQVVCGGASIPTPGSAQQPADCKVVRFFDTAVG